MVLRTHTSQSLFCVLHCTCTRTHARTHALHILSIVCWNDQVSSSALVLLSGWEQQCSDDPFRQNSTIPPHQKVPKQSHRKKSKRCSLCATVQEKSGSDERHQRTDLSSPYQYFFSGCGAHHPASTTVTPEIKIMSGLKLWLHPRKNRQGSRMPVMLFLGRIIPCIESIRSEVASKYSHTSSTLVLMMTIFSVWHLEWNKKQPNSAADASAAASASSAAARCSSSHRYPLTG